MRKSLWILSFISTPVFANILEERIVTGSSQLVPTPFVLNPAQNLTSVAVFGAAHVKKDEKQKFVINPRQDNAEVTQNTTQKDLVLGGQYPLGGAAVGAQYSEQRRTVNGRHINRNEDNNELFVARDYRILFSVDFLPQLRGAFTFHHTALQADLEGNFFIGRDDRTRYKGTTSGYGLGLNYQAGPLAIGAFSHAPMRGKAMVEGEQKIISEPGVYGLTLNLRATPILNIAFNATGWSYKRDERDDQATSPSGDQGISLRGVDLSQFYRKTLAYGFAGEYSVTPLVVAKAGLSRQNGVFLFEGDSVPGDNKEAETKATFTEMRAGAAIKSKAFIAELNLFYTKGEQSDFKSGSRFGQIGSFKSSGTGMLLSLGAAL